MDDVGDDDDLLIEPRNHLTGGGDPAASHIGSIVPELEMECEHWRSLFESERARAADLQRQVDAMCLWRAQAERCLLRCVEVARDVRAAELTRPSAHSIGGGSRSIAPGAGGAKGDGKLFEDEDEMTMSMRRIERLTGIVQDVVDLVPSATANVAAVLQTERESNLGTRQLKTQRLRRGQQQQRSNDEDEVKLMGLKNLVQHRAQRRAAAALQCCVLHMDGAKTLALRKKYFSSWLLGTSERRRIRIVSAQLQKLRRRVLISMVEHRIVFQTFVRRYFSHWLVVLEVRRHTRSVRSLIGLFSKHSVMLAMQVKNRHEQSVLMVEDCAVLLNQQSTVLRQLDLATQGQDDLNEHTPIRQSIH